MESYLGEKLFQFETSSFKFTESVNIVVVNSTFSFHISQFREKILDSK